MSLFGANAGFGAGGFGNTTTDSHNPMKVCVNLDQAQRSYTQNSISPFCIKLKKFIGDLEFYDIFAIVCCLRS